MNQNPPRIIEAQTEERPVFFDFKKSDLTGFHPMMANLTYDPFPDAKNEQVVRTEIVGWELVLRAKLIGPSGSIRMGIAINYQGHKFGLVKVTEHINMESDECKFEVEGVASLTPCDPPLTLKRLRETLAASNGR